MWFAATALWLLGLWQAPQASRPDPADPSAEGLKALEARQYDLAIAHFSKAVEADPADYAARFHLALAQSYLHKDAEAIAGYKKVLELKPGLYEAEINLGSVLLRNRKPVEAVPHLEAAVSRKPVEFRPRFLLAEALFGAGDFARAEQSYRAALELDAKSADAELGLARSLVRLNRVAEAEPCFRRAAEKDPAARDGLLELAVWFEEHGRPEEAIAIFQQFPENLGAREHLGNLLAGSGRPGEAIPHLEWAVRKSPTTANQLGLARALRTTGQADKALALLENILKSEPASIEVRTDYARTLRDLRKYGAAAEQYEAVLKGRPDSAQIWGELAAMRLSLGDNPGTVAALDRARALGGEIAGHLYLRALAFEKMGDDERALQSYEAFLAASKGEHPSQELEAKSRVRGLKARIKRR